MAKQIQLNEKARNALNQGMSLLTHLVRVTLGPKGRNVVLDKKFGAPTITNDGVTIARELELPDLFENMGVQLLKEAAIKTNDVAGDGTTTATVLAYAIILEGLKNLAAGANPMILRLGLEKAAQAVIAQIRAQSQPVGGRAAIAQVASISAGSQEIGELIAEVMERVGKDGVITVEEGRGIQMETEYTEGMQFDRGFVSPYMTTNQEHTLTELTNPYLLITDKKISIITEILPILEKVLQSGRKEVVIIAEDIEGEALATLIVNQMRGAFNVLAVKAPGFGDRREAMLEDIAILTGGTVITEKRGLKLEKASLRDLGQARLVTATKDATTIVGGHGSQTAIQNRIGQIRALTKDPKLSSYDKEKLQERLAKLSGGVAVLKVGAATEVEMKEKKHRVDDALSATHAAAEEGIVPGGGAALIAASSVLDTLQLSGDEATGANILRRALQEPLRQIAINAGYDGAVVAANVASHPAGHGFNALTGEYVDMLQAGIIDPVKVTRYALQNAVSVATMVLSTDVLVSESHEASHAAAAGMGGMGGMGMM